MHVLKSVANSQGRVVTFGTVADREVGVRLSRSTSNSRQIESSHDSRCQTIWQHQWNNATPLFA